MVIDRTDEQQNPPRQRQSHAAWLFGCSSRNPSGPCGHGAATKRGRTHDSIRTQTKFCFNYLNPAGRPHMMRGYVSIVFHAASTAFHILDAVLA